MRYLYGAAVQGIQSFIFQTNELKDIVGASELVENICTDVFYEMLEDVSGEKIINAAGNIKYIFDTKEECARVVRDFPRKVVDYAPGITVSQAVVEIPEKSEKGTNYGFAMRVNELEEKLRAQRNKPMNPTGLGFMGVMRSRNTNQPVVYIENANKKQEFLDAATAAKRYERTVGIANPEENRLTTNTLCENAFGKKFVKDDPRIAMNIGRITGDNDWIAIIHADGNGLGQIVQAIGSDDDEKKFREFSCKLDEATRAAAVSAYNDLCRLRDVQDDKWGRGVIPIRPVVLGGDDFTVICRADLAVDYVTAFIRNFEVETRKKVGHILTDNKVFTKGRMKDCLTACAGIAYIKSSYPFYYGYELAEALCSRAKKDAKKPQEVKDGDELPASCIMFHKVQDSFVEDYSEIVKRELEPNDDVSFEFGPYYISEVGVEHKDMWTVDEILSKVHFLDDKGNGGNAIKSNIRTWLGLLHDNPEMAEQRLNRVKDIQESMELLNYVNEITVGRKDGFVTVYPAYDILALHTINTQKTNNIRKEKNHEH